MIKITYHMKGEYYDHLIFKHVVVARRFYKELLNRGATEIRWIEK